jgi:hypothetical protein
VVGPPADQHEDHKQRGVGGRGHPGADVGLGHRPMVADRGAGPGIGNSAIG